MTALSLLPEPRTEQAGPKGLLGLVLEAQRLNAELLGPAIGTTADALRRLAASLARHGRPPLLMPVSGPGERLTGAALALARGKLDAADFTVPLAGRHLLLVDGTVTGTVRLEEQARLLRRLGAHVHHAAVVRLLVPPGRDTPEVHELHRAQHPQKPGAALLA